MRLDWNGLLRGRQKPEDGAEVVLDGEVFRLDDAPPDRFLLVNEAACCAGCLPSPETTVEVWLDASVPLSRTVSVTGPGARCGMRRPGAGGSRAHVSFPGSRTGLG
jgi:membrane dipeptidase